MAFTQTKLESRFHFIFIAIAISVLLVDDPEKVYADSSLCNSYKNHVLALSVFYHVAMIMISIINTDTTTFYVWIFCLIFGIFQTFIADNYLCTHNFLQYPLNKYPWTDLLGECVPEYMIFSWSMFAFMVIKSNVWFNDFNQNNKIISIITSSVFGFVLLLSMEIATDLPEINEMKILALWRANNQNPKIHLLIGGFASYLIIPELCLSVLVAMMYHILPSTYMAKFLLISFLYAAMITMLYTLCIITVTK